MTNRRITASSGLDAELETIASDFAALAAELETEISKGVTTRLIPLRKYAAMLRAVALLAELWRDDLWLLAFSPPIAPAVNSKSKAGRPIQPHRLADKLATSGMFASMIRAKPPRACGRPRRWTPELAKYYLKWIETERQALEADEGRPMTELEVLRRRSSEFAAKHGKRDTAAERTAVAIQKDLDRARRILGEAPIRRSRIKAP